GPAGLDGDRPFDGVLGEIGKTEAYAEQTAAPAQCRTGGACLERGAREGGKLARLPYDRAKYGEDVRRAVMAQSDYRRRRELAVHGIADPAAGSERNSMRGRDSRRDMRLGVDRDCTGLRVQPVLFRGIGDGCIRADDLGVDGPRKRLNERPRPSAIGWKGFPLGPDAGAHDP